MSSSWKWPIGQSSVSGHGFRNLAKPAFVKNKKKEKEKEKKKTELYH